MKYFILSIIFICFLITGVYSQNLDIEGRAKVAVMDLATTSAHAVAREPDGTLSRMSVTTTPSIGAFIQGGVVFWVSTSGAHFKVVSIYDVGEVEWSNLTNIGIGFSARSDINGAGNTVAISTQSGHTLSAALQCASLAYSGYDDWYLPSRDELNEVFVNKAAINPTALSYGGQAFDTNGRYWSSTEFSSEFAWAIRLSDGHQLEQDKFGDHKVRAIRAISH